MSKLAGLVYLLKIGGVGFDRSIDYWLAIIVIAADTWKALADITNCAVAWNPNLNWCLATLSFDSLSWSVEILYDPWSLSLCPGYRWRTAWNRRTSSSWLISSCCRGCCLSSSSSSSTWARGRPVRRPPARPSSPAPWSSPSASTTGGITVSPLVRFHYST